jgi:hypothetical protein
VVGGNIDCLLPDVSVVNVLPDRWNWEVIYLAGQRVPGLVDVEFRRAHRIDRRAANGADGEAITSLGYKAADIIVKVRMWTPQQLADFQAITIPAVQPRPGKVNARPVSVSVDYPSLAMWGIFKLFVVEVAGPKRSSTPQLWEVTLTATEISPLVATSTATQKSGGVASAPNVLSGKPPFPPQTTPSQRINTPTLGQ